ncbi:MAG: RNA methyltransferase [Spirochaetes bacterium]|nr:RNA methyltransferase [Spirochaetota bacterium]
MGDPITSIDDSRLDVFRNVRDRDLRSEGIMIVEGHHCVERCVAAGFDVLSVLCENGRHAGPLADQVRIPVYGVGRDVMERVAGYGFHRGIMAAARRPAALAANEFISTLSVECPLGIVCVDRCASGENLGSIVRSAHAFGYGAVIASASADPFSRRVIRVSAGSVFSVPVIEAEDMGEVVQALKRVARCRVYAAVTDPSSAAFDACPVARRRAVLLGSEGSGLSGDLAALCDEAVHVPMSGAIDSLNLAVAAGIILQRFGINSPGSPRW